MGEMAFLRLGKLTVHLDLVTFIRWDFAGHEGTAQLVFVGGDDVWIQDREQVERLRLHLGDDSETETKK